MYIAALTSPAASTARCWDMIRVAAQVFIARTVLHSNASSWLVSHSPDQHPYHAWHSAKHYQSGPCENIIGPPATAMSKFLAIARLWRLASKLVACLLLPLDRLGSGTGDGDRSTVACDACQHMLWSFLHRLGLCAPRQLHRVSVCCMINTLGTLFQHNRGDSIKFWPSR